MKKTLIAFILTALAATASNATTIYSKDGTKINLDGRLSFELLNAKNKRTDLIDRGSRFRLHVYQDLGNDFTALANLELRFSDKEIGDNVHAKRLYAGFLHKYGKLTFGKQDLLGDKIGYSNFTYELGKIAKLTTAADKSVHFFTNDFNGFRFGVDYLFGQAAKHTNNDPSKDKLADKGNGFTLAMFYNKKFGKFAVDAAGGYGEKKAGTLEAKEYRQRLAGTSFRVAYDAFAIGFDWAHAKSPEGYADHKFRVGDKKFEKLDQFEVGVKYNLTKQNKVYAEYLWGTGKTENKPDGKFSGWFLGADHQLTKTVVFYLEGGSFKTKQDGNTLEEEKRIALGSRVYF
ncbi:porin [Caviibacterium pharyngocola]|uniref:Porin n=1 Tax=Caviibacterium pharyngocola TaxID=28159 RepID=A0A2M8RXJ4_9PAST|nr:porin [Caviibacterium pharyngocola]PJG83606.1 porin [Caviibacterium pharyngocola]